MNETDLRINEILKVLPYNTYDDLIFDCTSNPTHISFVPSKIIQISNIEHPYFTSFGLWIIFILATIVSILLSVIVSNYFALCFIPIYLFASISLKKNKIFKFIAVSTLIFNIFFKIPVFINIFCISYITIIVLQYIWWSFITSFSLKTLRYNQEAFIWLWDCDGVCFIDNLGNRYFSSKPEYQSDLNQNYNDTNYYSELANIVKTELDASNIDIAIEKACEFYECPIPDLTDKNIDEKEKILSSIIMSELEIDNIEQALKKIKEFYNLEN